MAAQFEMETIVVEVRQRAGIAGVSPCGSREFGRCRSGGASMRALKRTTQRMDLAEVGVREVQAQARKLKSHLKERLKRQLDWSEPLATWLVRHSANCLSRYRIQADGKDAGSAAHRKTLETSSCRVWRGSSILASRGTARSSSGRRCGEKYGWHFRWSSWAHIRKF